jgi:hypothetical protein
VRALPDAWINAEMRAFVYNHAGCATLFADSVAQGVALFEAPALVVHVADWRYQLVGKITRAYQMMQLDVVLKLMLDKRQGRPLLLSEMKTWYAYGPALEIEEIENANRAYSIFLRTEVQSTRL